MNRIDSLYIEVIVYKKQNKKLLYLILKRSTVDKIFPGIYQIVTGTIKKKDKNLKLETSIQAAIREVYEETKLKPKRLWIIPVINSYYVVNKDVINFSPIFAVEVEKDSEPELSNEHQSYKWLPYEKAIMHLIWPSHKNALKLLNDYQMGKEKWGNFLEINLNNNNYLHLFK